MCLSCIKGAKYEKLLSWELRFTFVYFLNDHMLISKGVINQVRTWSAISLQSPLLMISRSTWSYVHHHHHLLYCYVPSTINFIHITIFSSMSFRCNAKVEQQITQIYSFVLLDFEFNQEENIFLSFFFSCIHLMLISLLLLLSGQMVFNVKNITIIGKVRIS